MRKRSFTFVLSVGIGVVGFCTPPAALRAREAPPTWTDETAPSRALPLLFVERGEHSFAASGGTLGGSFSRRGMELRLGGDELQPTTLRFAFAGASEDVLLVGREAQRAVYNLFLGKDPGRWKTGLGTFRSIAYQGLYDCIDIVLRESRRGDASFEYDVLVGSGGDLAQVVITFEGGGPAFLASDGSLVIDTPAGVLRQPPALTWQVLPSGERRYVPCRYRILSDQAFGFEIDAGGGAGEHPLVIDPKFSFLGGGGDESGFEVDAGADGSIFCVGETNSESFHGLSPAGGYDAFLCKFAPDGKTLEWRTLVGGADRDQGYDTKVAADGSVLFVGATRSTDFPTTAGAVEGEHQGGTTYGYDAFVVRLSSEDGQLLYSSYLGGEGDDLATALAPDGAGNLFVAGMTASADFPTTETAFDREFGGGRYDAFLVKVRPDPGASDALLYATFLGGEATDGGYSTNDNRYFEELQQNLVYDGEGVVTLAGATLSSDFPTTEGALDTTYNGRVDIYVARLRPDASPGEQLLAATFLGGSNEDLCMGIDLDSSGAVTLAGSTNSGDFPTSEDAFGTLPGGNRDVHFVRLSPDLDQVLYATRFGGGQQDYPWTMALTAGGEALLVGRTWGGGFPVTFGAFGEVVGGASDAFVAMIDWRVRKDDQLRYASYIGGSRREGDFPGVSGGAGHEGLFGIAFPEPHRAVLTGWTGSSDFPVASASEVFDATFDGPFDAILGEFDLRVPWARFTPSPVEGSPPLSVSFDGSSSEAPGELGITYAWDFGDGTQAEGGPSQEHTYETPGRFVPLLTVTTEAGLSHRGGAETVTVSCPEGDVAPWSASAVGEPSFPSSAWLEEGAEGQTLKLCSGDIRPSGASDQFLFIHQESTGDLELRAKVEDLSGHRPTTGVGLMFRASLAEDSPFVALTLEQRQRSSGEETLHLVLRQRSEAGSEAQSEGTTRVESGWISLERSGESFVGKISDDGGVWSSVRSTTLALPESILVGAFGFGDTTDRPGGSLRPLQAEVSNLEAVPPLRFTRGDCDGDGEMVINDGIHLLNFLFLGRSAPPCKAACDPLGFGVLDLTSAVLIFDYLFQGAAPPRPPFPDCGVGGDFDTTLGCEEPPAHCQ